MLFTDSLGIPPAVRVKQFPAALLPRRPEFGRRDVPVGPALLRNGTQILAQIFHSGPTEEPVALVDLVDNETGLKDDRMGDHWVVAGISVFGDVEVLLHDPPRVGEEGPVGANPVPIFIGLGDVVGADRDEPAIADLELTRCS